jgi:uncharacterized protein YlaI
MIEKCALCRKEKELENSHIIPKFVFKWMKKTGSSKLRQLTAINKSVEDGPTKKLLCGDCEDEFSAYEDYFARFFFHPLLDNIIENKGPITIPSIDYNENLYLFSMSLLWRGLKWNINNDNIPMEHEEQLNRIESKWQTFLANKNYPDEANSIHMFIADKTQDFEGKPQRFDFYMMRGTDATVASGEGQLFIFSKIARFLFIVPLIGFEEKDFINTNIQAAGGTYINPQIIEDSRISGFLVNRANEIHKYANELSEKQQAVIKKNFDKEKDNLDGSDLHRSLTED